MKIVVIALICLFNLSAAAQLSWYKCLSGKIDKYPVFFHLHKQSHSFTGYYYYKTTQQPIYFFGEDSTVAGKIKLLAALPDGESEENFLLSLSGKTCSGTWTNSSGTTLNFSGEEITQTPSWDYVFTTGSVKLRPQKEDSPEASYESASVWPQGNSDQSMFLKRTITKWYANDSSATDIGKIFLKEKKQLFTDYISENKDVPDSELVESPAFNLDNIQTINVVFQSPKLLTLSNSGYSYTGGAHGNYGTNYLCIDLAHNKRLYLEDVISGEGREQLNGLLEKYFRKQRNLKASDRLTEGGLFEDKIEPNDNFFVTGKGIGFDYTPYEIGPYAIGEIVIFIPFSELPGKLKADFTQLISSD